MPNALLLLVLLQTNEVTTPVPGRVGVVVDVGPEVLVPLDGAPVSAGFRVGGGARLGLARRDEDGVSVVPALALVGGFVTQNAPGGYLEARAELAVVSRARLLQPALVAYGIVGGLATRHGPAPYVGLGFGWNPPMLPDERRRAGSYDFSGMGAFGAVLCFVLMGRLEVRVHPLQPHGGALTSVLIGVGF